jgi:UDP-N-acetylglucosamine acyltransferase
MRGNVGASGLARVHPNTIVAPDAYIGPFCLIGEMAENKATWGQPILTPPVTIGAESVLSGHVTVDAGTDGPTVIGARAFIMKHVHIGHDVRIGDDVTIAPHASIGGRVTICDRVNIGMGAAIHPRVTIPEGCMIGMNAVITKRTELAPWRKYAGNPARDIGSNEDRK